MRLQAAVVVDPLKPIGPQLKITFRGVSRGVLRADEEQPWARLGQESTRVDGKRVDRVAEAVERFNRGYQIIAAVRGCKPGDVLKNRDLRPAVLQFFKQTDEMPERSRLVAC